MTGTITITPNTGDIISGSTLLTASYSGGGVTYQWNKNGATVPGATNQSYTPPDFGSYSVTVSATGFRSKTSAAVTPSIIGISTLAQLKDISDNAANLGRKYKLLANISGVDTPIGDISTGTAFSGDFDGNDKSIAVNITSGSTVDGGEYGFVTVAGLFAASAGPIYNLTVTGTVNVSSGSGSMLMAGGVVGALLGAEISKVASSVAVTGGGTYFEMGVGGVAGVILPGATINSTYATGAVTATSNGRVSAGGIAGTSQGGAVSNVYTTGNISATTSGTKSVYAGGIIGAFGDGGSVSYAYATGSVSSNGTGTGNGNSAGENEVAIAACGIVGGNSTSPVRYTVALDSSISIDSGCYSRNYKTLAFRISTTHLGIVTTNGAINYGKKDLATTGDQSYVGALNDAQRLSQNGTDTDDSTPTENWWKTTAWVTADWTNVWEWNGTKSLPTFK